MGCIHPQARKVNAPTPPPALNPAPVAKTQPERRLPPPTPQPLPPTPAEQPEPNFKFYVAIFDYVTRTPQDLPFMRGDKLKILEEKADGWWLAENAAGQQGYVPKNHIAPSDSLDSYDWYHGNVRRQEAESSLINHPAGTFLVRQSESQAGDYSLSVKDPHGVKHYRIRSSNGSYFIRTSNMCRTLPLLIESHYNSSHGLCAKLQAACPKVVSATQELDCTTADNWEVDRSTVQLGKLIGSGEFGEVYEGWWKGSIRVAVKTLKPSCASDEFFKEAGVMKALRHENLIALYAVVTKSVPMLMITEFMSNGDLLGILRDPTRVIDIRKLVIMMSEVAGGMAFLEEHNYIHRDLAARNILVGDNLICKVADFGLARITEGGANGDEEGIYSPQAGAKFPVKWTAPEAAFFNRFTIKSDVWSFGILMVEMVTKGQIPYPGMTNAQVLQEVSRGYRVPLPGCATPEVYQIMLSCWKAEPEDRPTFDALFNQLYDLFCDQRYTDVSSVV